MRLPIDTTGMTILAASAGEPVVDFETKRPKTDLETGSAIYAMQLVLLAGESAEVVTVKLAGPPTPLTVGSPVRVVGLTATPWAMGDRSGIAFRATSVTGAPGAGSRAAAGDNR